MPCNNVQIISLISRACDDLIAYCFTETNYFLKVKVNSTKMELSNLQGKLIKYIAIQLKLMKEKK